MAYNVKYRIYFSDIDNAEYRADISFDGYAGQIYELDGVGNNCQIEWGKVDYKFCPIMGSGCTLSFYNDNLDLSDLFVVSPTEASFVIWRKTSGFWYKIFSGWVNPEVYDEDYTFVDGQVTVTANDGLNAIGRQKYFSGANLDSSGLVIDPSSLGFDTIRNVISECLADVGFTRIYTIYGVRGETSLLDDMKVDLSNYVDEDYESMTKREVLATILEPLTLKCFVFGHACWIVDPCMLAQPTVSFKAYSGAFVPIPSEDGTVNLIKDISNPSYNTKFVGGNQSISIVGGYNRININYSPYPDIRKAVATQIEDVVIDPSTNNSWTAVSYVPSAGGNADWGGYMFRNISAYDYSNYGFTFQSDKAGFSEHHVSEEDDTALSFDALGAALGTLDGEKCLILKESLFGSGQAARAPQEYSIVLKTGELPKSGDTIKVTFKALINYSLKGNWWTHYTIPIRVRQNDSYANIQPSGYVTGWTASSTQTWPLQISSDSLFRSWVDVSITISNIPSSGRIWIIIGRETKVYNSGGLSGLQESLKNDFHVFFKDFNTYINGTQVNEDDVEYLVESNVDYMNSKTIEINNSSRRVNGILDRGAFINANNEHETNFYRLDNPQTGSIGLTMGQAILSNYQNPYRSLQASLTHNELLRNTSGDVAGGTIPKAIDNIFTPISIIQDTNYLGSKKFLFMGGNFDICNKVVSGRWDELHQANLTIT